MNYVFTNLLIIHVETITELHNDLLHDAEVEVQVVLTHQIINNFSKTVNIHTQTLGLVIKCIEQTRARDDLQ